jgi:glycosyltransferase involved in cell wall biosynthesis
MAKWRMGWQHEWLDRELSWWAAQTLDRHVTWNLPDCDVFVAISGSGLAAARKAKSRGARYVCDRGSSHVRFSERILAEEYQRWGQRFPGIDSRAIRKEEEEYNLADVITIPSVFCKGSFVQEGVPAEKLRVIPYGVDLGRFSPSGEPSTDSFEVLFVGQVSFRKGIPYLLKAFERLKHPRKRLTIVGAVQPEMQRFLQGPVGAQVRFLGARPRNEVRRLMSQSHVFVLPSVEDGFGMVLVEALACGCPVIGTEHTGAPDLVTEGREGFVVPIRDSVALTQAMERLSQDPALCLSMREAALKRVQQLGGWDQYGDAFVRMLKDLALPLVLNPHRS